MLALSPLVDTPIELGATVVILTAFLALLRHVMRQTDSSFKRIEEAVNLTTATLQSLHMTIIQQEFTSLSDELREKKLSEKYDRLYQEMQGVKRLLQLRGTKPYSDDGDITATIVDTLTKRGA